ncbi:MAG: DUF6261 family protein [Prevotellaceae bacterium]|jgi:hypothetical protein|nr:DUF6261 family protein [Prevotellaceae bacterium]
MNILKIDFHSLRNEEWFQFMTEFKYLVEKSTPETLGVAELFTLFLTNYADSDTAAELIRKSPETAKMLEADNKRDATFRGFADAVASYANHFNADKQRAAEDLAIVLDHFGNLAKKPSNEETAGMYNLLQELNGKHAPQVQLLAIADWVQELEQNNNDYETLVKQRNTELAERPKVRMVDARRQTQDAYRKIVERIEALILVNGADAYAAFVNELNTFIKRYNNIVSQRQGRREASKEPQLPNNSSN